MPTRGTRLPNEDIGNEILGLHGQTAGTASPSFQRAGYYYVENPGTVPNNRDVTGWADQQGYLVPHLLPVLLTSFTTAGTGTSTGTAFPGLGAMKDIDMLVDVTFATGTAPTMDVYVDSQLDGTTWVNLARLAAITTASQVAVHLTKRQSSTSIVVTSDAGAGTVRAIGWGDNVRIRKIIGDATSQFSARVWIVTVS